MDATTYNRQYATIKQDRILEGTGEKNESKAFDRRPCVLQNGAFGSSAYYGTEWNYKFCKSAG